jgi:hypothetical protein
MTAHIPDGSIVRGPRTSAYCWNAVVVRNLSGGNGVSIPNSRVHSHSTRDVNDSTYTESIWPSVCFAKE